MRTSDFGRHALAICAAAAMLAGCDGAAQSLLAPPGSFQQNATRGAARSSVVTATAQKGYVGILGGGPVYKHIPKNIDELDRKSTRLNSSHQLISYAVFCLKKKKKQ